MSDSFYTTLLVTYVTYSCHWFSMLIGITIRAFATALSTEVIRHVW